MIFKISKTKDLKKLLPQAGELGFFFLCEVIDNKIPKIIFDMENPFLKFNKQ
ncbi:MAG: hypothetical protein AAB352_04130 [Patescibacteria group bacterium]